MKKVIVCVGGKGAQIMIEEVRYEDMRYEVKIEKST